MFKPIVITNNSTERSVEFSVSPFSLMLQIVPAVNYIGITFGSRSIRCSVFLYRLPADVPVRAKFYTSEKRVVISGKDMTTEREIQIGRGRILGIEKVRATIFNSTKPVIK